MLVITYLPLVPAQNFGCAYIQKYSDKIKQTRKAEKEPWSAKTGQICPPPISIRHPLSHLSALYNTTRDAISLRQHLLNLQYMIITKFESFYKCSIIGDASLITGVLHTVPIYYLYTCGVG